MSGTETGSADAQGEAAAPSSWNRMWAALGIAAVWWIALVTLAVRTANPVTFNLAQLRNSPVVIAGHVENLGDGLVSINRTWPENVGLESELKIDGLDELKLEVGGNYLLPLTEIRSGEFEVTAIKMPSPDGADEQEIRFVYPDSEEARKQLESSLEELSPKESD